MRAEFIVGPRELKLTLPFVPDAVWTVVEEPLGLLPKACI